MLNRLQEIYGLSYDKPVEQLADAKDIEQIETGSDIKITLAPGYPSRDKLDKKLADLINTGEYNVVLSVLGANGFINVIDDYEEENDTDVLLG